MSGTSLPEILARVEQIETQAAVIRDARNDRGPRTDVEWLCAQIRAQVPVVEAALEFEEERGSSFGANCWAIKNAVRAYRATIQGGTP